MVLVAVGIIIAIGIGFCALVLAYSKNEDIEEIKEFRKVCDSHFSILDNSVHSHASALRGCHDDIVSLRKQIGKLLCPPPELKTFTVLIQGRKPLQVQAESWRHYYDSDKSCYFEKDGKTIATFQNVEAVYEEGVVE